MEEVKTLSKSRVAVISSVIVLAIIVLLLGVRAFGQPLRVQVLGCDGNFTYLDVDGKVYTAPSYVYEYIMSFETK